MNPLAWVIFSCSELRLYAEPELFAGWCRPSTIDSGEQNATALENGANDASDSDLSAGPMEDPSSDISDLNDSELDVE